MTIYVPGKLTFKKETVAADPYFNNVSLLLHGDGANGSTTILDSSPSPKTVTAAGNAQISTAQSKFGGSSIAFDGNGDYLQIANTNDANFGSGDFTIEFWMYASEQGLGPLVHQTSLAFGTGWIIWIYNGVPPGNVPTKKLTFMANGEDIVLTTTSDAYADNTWTHIAVVKSGTGSGNIKIYSNGSTVATGTYATALNNATQPLQVGGIINGISWNTTAYLNGYIDDLRITKGVARYTSNFTPPTAPFPEVLG